jgi:hypothetical protein
VAVHRNALHQIWKAAWQEKRSFGRRLNLRVPRRVSTVMECVSAPMPDRKAADVRKGVKPGSPRPAASCPPCPQQPTTRPERSDDAALLRPPQEPPMRQPHPRHRDSGRGSFQRMNVDIMDGQVFETRTPLIELQSACRRRISFCMRLSPTQEFFCANQPFCRESHSYQ